LSRINQVKSNIVTIEEPIEYELDGINQVSINEKAGRTFSMLLRSVLRQDPDVIMVGEMRDIDTATTAMQASLTGHLVLSTIHTNNTVATIARLRNLGIPSYLIASTISGIVAQRLVRVICPFCKTKDSPNPEDLRKLGLANVEAKDLEFYRGNGCSQCGGTGFRGIQGIFEILVLSQRIREHITTEATEAAIKQLALAEGMQTLAQAGVEKVLKGITSVDELRRVIQADEEFGAICTNCGYILNSEFVACPQCGQKVIETCQGCSRIIDPHWKFCPYCSTKIPYSTPILRAKKVSSN
jgi:type II secretory ATPase GspE/PulE/Tfp pilus assembly ATPase PilB-like protein/RNA polymerase subunit RPABC4/transcription elongation factor Spt4